MRSKITAIGDYELHQLADGSYSIRQISSGEIMHASCAPIEEADLLYVRQSNLEKLFSTNHKNELNIWDIGLGAAANAMAAIRCMEKLIDSSPTADFRKTNIISFEKDLSSLYLAIENKEKIPHLSHPSIQELLNNKHWRNTSGHIEWHLIEGDFLETMATATKPHIVFFDPFSAKTDKPLWTTSTFLKMRKAIGDTDCSLFTYSSSTAVRASLLFSGFYVCHGTGTTMKLETTAAHSLYKPGLAYLGQKWLSRWEKSPARIPADLPINEIPAFEERIRKHQQFKDLGNYAG